MLLSPNYAQDGNKSLHSEEIRGKLANNAKNIYSLKSTFTQNKYISSLGISVESKGMFLYKKQDKKIRWEYTSPNKFLVIIKNGEIHTQNQENSFPNNNVSKLFSELNSIILSSLNGEILSDNNFTYEIKENNKQFIIELSPRSNSRLKPILEKLNIFINKTDLAIAEIKLTEPVGDYTSIVLDNVQMNVSVNDSNFQF